MENNKEEKTDMTHDKMREAGFWKELWNQMQLVWYLFRDPDVPIYLKAVPIFALIYLISPIDLMPDMVLGLGQVDDITVLLLGAKMFIEMSPADIVSRYMNQLSQGIDPGAEVDELKRTIIIDAD